MASIEKTGPIRDLRRRLTGGLLFLSVIGPGLITATVDNDAGGVATYALAGTQFGNRLLWTLIPVTFLMMISLEMSARIGVITRKGMADLVREVFGLRQSLFLLFLVFLANIGTTTSEFLGIASSIDIVLAERGISLAWHKYFVLPVLAGLVMFVLVRFNYRKLEKVFLIAVVLYVSYIIAAFKANPDWSRTLKDLVIPNFVNTPLYVYSMIAVIGTTITPWMHFYLHATMLEKGISEQTYRFAKWDVVLSCIVTNVIAFFIIVACSATLYASGTQAQDVGDIGKALIPFAGRYAGLLFAFGLFNASLFGAAILPISTAFTICETMGWESGVNKGLDEAKAFYSIIAVMMGISLLFVLIFPPSYYLIIMKLSQFAQGVLLPIFLYFLVKLASNRELLGNYVNKRCLNYVSWFATAVMTVLSLYLIVTLFIYT